jgi:hypothetical protein
MAMNAMVKEMHEDQKKAKRIGGKRKRKLHNFKK